MNRQNRTTGSRLLAAALGVCVGAACLRVGGALGNVDRDTGCLGYAESESQQYCLDGNGNSVLCAVEGGSPIPSKEAKVIAWRNGYFTGRAEAEGRTGVLGPTFWPQLQLYCIENPSSTYYQAMRYMYENHFLDMDKPR